MKKNNQLLLRLIALITVAAALAGCRILPWLRQTDAPAQSSTTSAAATATHPPAGEAQQEAIRQLLENRMKAVNTGDQKLYLSTVLPSDPVLLKEEEDLIRAAAGLGIRDFRLESSGLLQREDGVSAMVEQNYTVNGQAHKCRFQAIFKTENGKLYYCGPDFALQQGGHVMVWHTDEDKELAGALLEAETEVLGQMDRLLSFTSAGNVSIKLFRDQQVFLQSVKLDLPEWVGGWHEYGESIKSYTGAYGNNAANYKPMLNHESTHRMVSELSNDNAAYWLQEGLAGVFEIWLDNPGGPWLSASEVAMEYTPYATHKTIDLEKIGIEDGNAVTLYYATSKAYAAFLLDQYGWEKMRAALESMKKYQMIPVTAAEKIQETNGRTDEAIQAVFGLDDNGLQAKFNQWLAKMRQ